MMLAFVAESILVGQHVLKSPQRRVLSGQNDLDSLHCRVMADTTDGSAYGVYVEEGIAW